MADLRLIHGLKSIAAMLGTTPAVALAFRRAGAPIHVRGTGRRARYFADAHDLVTWVRHYNR